MRPVFLFPRVTILDCGASRTTLAVFSRGRAGRLRLEQQATVPHGVERGPEVSWLEKTTAVLPLLRSRVEPVGPVTVVLPPHLTLMKMLGMPLVGAAKREKIIRFESQQSIPYPLTDVVWDRLITGENGEGCMVLLCAAKLEVLDPLCAAVAAVGLVPSVLVPSAVALAAGLSLTPADSVSPVLLINIGARSTTLVLRDRNRFQARSLPLGGNNVMPTSAEVTAGNSVLEEDPKLRSPCPEEITPAVRSFASRLAQEITRTLDYFHHPITEGEFLRLMITGGASRQPGLAGLLAAQLKVPVHPLDVGSMIELGREAGDFNQDEANFLLADCVGGAALRLRAGQRPLDLLPPRLRHQAKRRRLRPWLAVAAGLVGMTLVPAVVHYRRMVATVHAQNAGLDRELATLRTHATYAQEQRQRLAEARQQREAWRKIQEARTGWVRFLGEIQERLAPTGDVWLERMQVLPASGENDATKPATGSPLRIAFSGLLRLKGGADANAVEDSYQRVRRLLENLAGVSEVAAVESERFESAPSGFLRFDFVLVLKEPSTL